MCKYHIVFTPKYRRKVIYNQYKEDIRDIIKTLCKYKGVEIIEGHLMPDHIHMLMVSIPPKYSISQFLGYLKGKSALMIYDKHANLKYKYGNRHFGAEGYYITILLVSHSMEDVAEYVDRIIVMNKGSVMYDDTPREVFRHYKELEEVGLAAPQVTYIMHELKARGADVDVDATTIEEAAEEIARVWKQNNQK